MEKQQMESAAVTRIDTEKLIYSSPVKTAINEPIEVHIQSQQLADRYEQRLNTLQQELFEKQNTMITVKEELESLKNIRIDDEMRNNQIKETSRLWENKSNTIEIRNRALTDTVKQFEDQLNNREEKIAELETELKKSSVKAFLC